tara:strand:- start:9888 stop:10148 length:261 start_codon:yes stop_codon:yes gene_type:complete
VQARDIHANQHQVRAVLFYTSSYKEVAIQQILKELNMFKTMHNSPKMGKGADILWLGRYLSSKTFNADEVLQKSILVLINLLYLGY